MRIKNRPLGIRKAQTRQEVFKTGGGLPEPGVKTAELDDLILATMDPLTVEGHCNEFDADHRVCPILEENSDPIEFILENSGNSFTDEISMRTVTEEVMVENPPVLLGEPSTSFVVDETSESQRLASRMTGNTEIEKGNWKSYSTNDFKQPATVWY